MIQVNKRRGFFIEDILNPSFGPKRSKIQLEGSNLRKITSPIENGNVASCSSNVNEDTTDKKNVINFEDWPSWIYCTRYSDRPSAGPRNRKERKKERKSNEKRPRTAFTADQLTRLQVEFEESKYLTDCKRKKLSSELDLNESQIKIWFQNKRAKLKKVTGKHDNTSQ